MGTKLLSSHKIFAPNPEQLTMTLYSVDKEENEFTFCCINLPPLFTNFSLAQGKNNEQSVSRVVKYEPYFQSPGHNLSSFSVALR